MEQRKKANATASAEVAKEKAAEAEGLVWGFGDQFGSAQN